MKDDLSKSYFTPPATLPGFPDAKRAKPKTGMGGGKKRKRWIDKDGNIIEWDYQHGRVEKFDPKGKHLGEFNPNDGAQTKPKAPGRTVTPTMFNKPGKKQRFILAWYSKTNDDLVGEERLLETSEKDVRKAFDLDDDEYPGDCLTVTSEHESFLQQRTSVNVDLDRFDYFVEYTPD